MPLARPADFPLGSATTEAFYTRSDEVHRTFDRSLIDTEACLGRCALLIEPEGQQPDPRHPEQ